MLIHIIGKALPISYLIKYTMMISVCIATYNGEKYIAEQLESILKQSKNVDEIIISDDSSMDRTVDIIKQMQDTRIVLLEQQKFRSPIFNFENALTHCKGDIIFLSDQDDIWKYNKVEEMTNYLEKYDIVVSDCEFIGNKTNGFATNFELRNSGTGLLKNFIKNSYLGNSMAFRRTVLEKSLPFPKNIPMHDIWLGMIGELYFKPIFIKESLSYFRRHETTFTSLKNRKSPNSMLSILTLRWNLIKAIIFNHFHP